MTDLMAYLVSRLSALRSREEGQTMAEYAIILVVVAVAATVAWKTLGSDISGALGHTSTSITNTTTGP